MTDSKPTGMPRTRLPDGNQWQLTSRRINAIGLMNGATRYLEVGVFQGNTFRAVDCANRCGVDPDPKFDVASIRDSSTEFHVCTSDAFFTTTAARQFDTIFLDGLHTFEQTLRDFLNSLCCAHARTVWLIDDTWPSDCASALPSLAQTDKFRALTNDQGTAWHGDVFKLIFALHDFFPMFDWRTVVDQGNPQTILVRAPRQDFQPRWNNLATISTMGYADFVLSHALLNSCTEVEALAWLEHALHSQHIVPGGIPLETINVHEPTGASTTMNNCENVGNSVKSAAHYGECVSAVGYEQEAQRADEADTLNLSTVLSQISAYRRLGRDADATALAAACAAEVAEKYGPEIAVALQRGPAGLPEAQPGVHLINGPPGAGKSTVGELLSAFGFETVDGDKELAQYVDKTTEEAADASMPESGTVERDEFEKKYTWAWNAETLNRLISSRSDKTIFIYGTATNIPSITNYFKTQISLVVPPEMLKERLQARDPIRYADKTDALDNALMWAKELLQCEESTIVRSDRNCYSTLCDIINIGGALSVGEAAVKCKTVVKSPPAGHPKEWFPNMENDATSQDAKISSNVKSICSSISSFYELWRDIDGSYPYNYQNLSQLKSQTMLRAISYTKERKVLEIGCNSGLYTLMISNYASSIDAIDIDYANVQRALAGFRFARSNGWCLNNINFECARATEFLANHEEYDCLVAALVLYYFKDDEIMMIKDYIQKNISRLIIQCRPARRKLVENNPQYGRVSYTSLYGGMYDIAGNLQFINDCGFRDVRIFGMGDMEDDHCPVIIADKGSA